VRGGKPCPTCGRVGGHDIRGCQTFEDQKRLKEIAGKLLTDCGLTKERVIATWANAEVRKLIAQGMPLVGGYSVDAADWRAALGRMEATVSRPQPRQGPWKLKDDLS